MWDRRRSKPKPQGEHLRLEVAIAAMLALLVVDILDSFQIPSAADERGRLLTSRILGEMADVGRESGQDKVAVALITQGTLAAWETGPPPPYQRQADLILRLAYAKPKAIFLDFLYAAPRESPEARAYFGTAIEAAQASGVPVFTGPIAERPEFADFAGARQVDLGFSLESVDDYPFSGLTERTTAAAALYLAYCEDPDANCDPSLVQRIVDRAAAPMSLQWRPRAPASLAFFWPQDEIGQCAFATGSWIERVRSTGEIVWREATRGVRPPSDLSHTACFPHLAAPANLLMSEQVDDALLAEFAKDRVVLVGSAYEGSADETLAPGYGRIPGVFQHAMALDNLITFGPDYRRQPPQVFYQLGGDDLLETVLSILLLAFGSWAIHRVVRAAPGPEEAFLDAAAWRRRVVGPAVALYAFAAAAVIGPFAAGYFVSQVFMWAPANAIGVVVAVIGVGALVLPRNVVARLRDAGVLSPLLLGLAAMILIGAAAGAALSAHAPGLPVLFTAVGAGIILFTAAMVGGLVVALARPRA